MARGAQFTSNVFINCPFDSDYLPLLRPLLFTVVYMRFTPQIASATLGSGASRLDRITSLIAKSKFAIHDLSRIRAATAGEYFRLNMPFELGIDVGCRLFKGTKWARKQMLILEAKPYRFHRAISDLSGVDIEVHHNKSSQVVAKVRHWLQQTAKVEFPGPSALWGRFNEFMADNHDALIKNGYSKSDIKGLPIGALIQNMKSWTAKHS